MQELLVGLPPMPAGSRVTVEPGGQLELSTPPAHGVAQAVAALRSDRQLLKQALASVGFGTAPLGADPARPPERVNPAARYVAMEHYFDAAGCARSGRQMMSSTAALQVNVDAGPASGWAERLGRIRDLLPVLVALSACSPLLGGHSSGWASMRQQAWQGIDHLRTAPVPTDRPTTDWADYALGAPVLLLPPDASTAGVSFGDWLRGRSSLGRRPTTRDLDHHLTTLFPPVRPRGYLEIRCLDAVPDRWWPALAAIVATLVDDQEAAGEVAELCRQQHDRWRTAAQRGLRDPGLRALASRCLDVAVRHCPAGLRADVQAYAELVGSGRTPGDLLLHRARATDPLTVLTEEAHA